MVRWSSIFEYVPRSIAGSWSTSITNFLRSHYTDSQCGYVCAPTGNGECSPHSAALLACVALVSGSSVRATRVRWQCPHPTTTSAHTAQVLPRMLSQRLISSSWPPCWGSARKARFWDTGKRPQESMLPIWGNMTTSLTHSDFPHPHSGPASGLLGISPGTHILKDLSNKKTTHHYIACIINIYIKHFQWHWLTNCQEKGFSPPVLNVSSYKTPFKIV